MLTPTFSSEWEFTQAVIELAESYGWKSFHIPNLAYKAARIPQGFPDLLLRYKDNKGGCTMVVAELKTDDEENSTLSDPQQEFLEDFAQLAPTFVFRYQDWEYIEEILRDGPPDTTGQIIEPSPQFIRSKQWLPPQRNIDAIVCQLVEKIGSSSFPRGNLAGLRRMDPDAPESEAFWRLMTHMGLSNDPHLENEWALIMHGIALMTPEAHDSEMSVGKALFEGGDNQRTRAFYSRSRLNRLLTARGPMLRTLLARMFRMMGTEAQPFNWGEMAWFILNQSYDEGQVEGGRQRIARDYYIVESRAESRSAQESND